MNISHRRRQRIAILVWLGLSVLIACKEKPADVIKDALPLEKAAEAGKDRAVYVTGKITAGDRGDPHFVDAGANLLIQRRGEIYAWVKRTRKVEKQVDGKTVQVEEHSCVLEWTREPDEDITDNDWCQKEDDEQNLPRRFFPDNDRTADLKITAGEQEYTVTGDLTFVNIPDLTLTKKDMAQPFHLKDGYFYHGSFCAEHTELGCERVRFLGKEYDRKADYTVIGALEGTEFKPLVKGKRSYLILGAGDIEAVIEKASE